MDQKIIEKLFNIPRTIRLLAIYIIILLVGATVFVKLEEPAERNRCRIAQDHLGEKVAAFGDSYFYALALNKKMCNGIRRIKEDGVTDSEVAENLQLFYNWEAQGCSREGYDLILDELERKPQLEASFSQLSDKIVGMSEFDRFDEEVLEISGATFRALMEESATVAIDNYVTAKSHCQNQWNFHSSFFFAGTVATTIGYGHMVPQTVEGRSFFLIFMLFGIPFFAMLTKSISSEINFHILQRKKGLITPCCDYILGGVLLIILLPVFIFSRIEEWSLFEAFYFSLVTLSTIGFGDIVPREDPPSSYALYKKNETKCLNHLVNPMPAQHAHYKNPCAETVFSSNAELYFDFYRVCIFFWIICGLVWLGGIIQIICHKIEEDVSQKTKTNVTYTNEKRVTQI